MTKNKTNFRELVDSMPAPTAEVIEFNKARNAKLNNQTFLEACREADRALVKEFAKTMPEVADWEYVDPPGKFSHEMWKLFLSIYGDGQYLVIISSEGPDWIRGQLLVSPQGIQNMKDWVAKND